ncbi:MAG: discoidin domain-containing protein [Lachnospiraceae bacterium]|nr:discoidin domain-containing protein [Lachnospiraceae bacterium]
MKNKENGKNVILAVLAVIIAGALGTGIWAVKTREPEEKVNTNVTLVSAPEQTEFEVHPEWVLPEPEVVDYGENIALGRTVSENGHTQVYHCRNINDGETLTYWEGRADDYPNEITFDMEESVTISGARILLNPRSNWGARTQEVEIQISGDNENFTTVYPKSTLSFDPNTGNYAYMEFDTPVEAWYIRFVFYANTGATGGQAAEIEIYAPQE